MFDPNDAGLLICRIVATLRLQLLGHRQHRQCLSSPHYGPDSSAPAQSGIRCVEDRCVRPGLTSQIGQLPSPEDANVATPTRWLASRLPDI
jgi:hypothetical protein